MISLIEALNYRCLRYVRQPLKPFQVLVGPNASGKSTFLDVVGFLHDLVTMGLEAAISNRSANFYDLLWRHEGARFELAIESAIPPAQRELIKGYSWDTVRYEIALRLDTASNELGIVAERGLLMTGNSALPTHPVQVPQSSGETLFMPRDSARRRCLFEKTLAPAQTSAAIRTVDSFDPEGRDLRDPSAMLVLNLGARKSTLANVPEDETRFPVSTWLKQLLREGVWRVALDPEQLRRPSPPGKTSGVKPDGSNIPWVVAQFERKSPERHKEWIQHLQTALPDLVNVTTIERPEDRHRYLSLEYRGGLRVPSWLVSDGTLRLLALTLPAFIEGFNGIYLVEEPENGIHPLAVETMYQALSWVKTGQVLLATHSPVMLAVARAEDVLCFTRDDEKGTEVVLGSKHPRLKDWKGEIDLGTLFASGVLG